MKNIEITKVEQLNFLLSDSILRIAHTIIYEIKAVYVNIRYHVFPDTKCISY